ncbi:MFS transporter [Aquiflexum sp. LQ15W]|uniref:MFS transporter n=1 Tax=Cognataquiflexum nitidum TaxID=2922272 RepID=UPI001F136855|nr:MFS transporter [Cognataquiflexum nitidum]MCH6198369.1 MFS transporter [Cognataquiflexum nitidum]
MKKILPLIVLSQFLSTSLWFAGNAVLPDLAKEIKLAPEYLGHLTSAVQFGFIAGTLVFAVLTIADKFSPSWVFFWSSVIASAFNFAIRIEDISALEVLFLRFGTGFFLAGIYPVGMKIASDYFQKGLGKSLGFLIGALVLGTAFPHLVRSLLDPLPWKYVIDATSVLALIGGLMIVALVPNGPYRKKSYGFDFTSFFKVFHAKSIQSAAYGYFGHMWELYAFWAFLPFILQYYNSIHALELDAAFWSFTIIAVGAVSCSVAGILSGKFTPKVIASFPLAISGTCCFFSPLIIFQDSTGVLLVFLMVWGLAVTADSPMFSTMVAQNAPEATRGTSLTIVNSVGFGITIISIQLLNFLSIHIDPMYLFPVLGLGPLIGLIGMWKERN